MKVFKYEPQSTDDKGKRIADGHVRIRVMPLLDRLNLIEQEQSFDGKEVKFKDKIQHYYAIVDEAIEEVDLVIGGSRVQSIQDMCYFEGSMTVLAELYRVVLNGVQLGNGLADSFVNKSAGSKMEHEAKTMQ